MSDPTNMSVEELEELAKWALDARDRDEAVAELARRASDQSRTAVLAEALAALVEHIDLSGGCHPGCEEHDVARAVLARYRGEKP